MDIKQFWPFARKSASTPNLPINVPSNTVVSIEAYQTFTPNLPVFYEFANQSKLLEVYEQNAIVQAVINIRSQAYANGVIKARDLKTNEVICNFDESKIQVLKNLGVVFKNPNPIQSRKELFEQFKINQAVFGNGYMHMICADFGHPLDSLKAINNLPAYLVQHTITGRFFEQTQLNEVITSINLMITNSNTLKFKPELVLHRHEPNLRLDQLFYRGKSKLFALAKPISNIDAAFETINVLMRNRGAVGIYSNNDKDASGVVPLTDTEEKDVQTKLSQTYGTLDGQNKWIITKKPLTFQRTALTPEELGIYKEIETSSIIISNAFGVPPELTKTYVEGATFENQVQSVRRLYQDTIIPEANDDFEAINSWLRCREKGFELFIDYSHLPALQENQKEKAVANSLNEKTYMSAFLKGAIIYDVYLNAIGLPADKEIGSKRIWDLTPEQLAIIMSKPSQQPTNSQV